MLKRTWLETKLELQLSAVLGRLRQRQATIETAAFLWRQHQPSAAKIGHARLDIQNVVVSPWLGLVNLLGAHLPRQRETLTWLLRFRVKTEFRVSYCYPQLQSHQRPSLLLHDRPTAAVCGSLACNTSIPPAVTVCCWFISKNKRWN